MKFKKILIVSLMLAILAMGAVSASDDVSLTQNETMDDTGDVISASEDITGDDSLNQGNDEGSYKDLFDEIQLNKKNITLEKDYKYNPDTDSNHKTLKIGNETETNLTLIDGGNHIIDADGNSFRLSIYRPNFVLKNVIFKNINANSEVLGLHDKNIVVENCTFENITISGSNHLIWGKDKIEYTTVDKCRFINNSAQTMIDFYNNNHNITNCIFSNNNIANYLILISDGTGCRITNCTLFKNSEKNYYYYNGKAAEIDNGIYDFYAVVSKNCMVDVENHVDQLAEVKYHGTKSLPGKLSILFDGVEVYTGTYPFQKVKLDMVSRVPFGSVNMTMIYKDSKSEFTFYNGTITTDFRFDIEPGSRYNNVQSYEIAYDDSAVFHIGYLESITGNISLSYEGYNNPNVDYKKGDLMYLFDVSAVGLSVGPHKITATLSNDPKYADRTAEYTFYVTPKITVPSIVSAGEKEFLTLEFPDDYRGTVTLYNETYQVISSADVTGGKVKIPLGNLTSGTNQIIVNCSGVYETTVKIQCIENDDGFNASVNTNEIEVGDKVILTLNASKAGNFSVYVDGKLFNETALDNATLAQTISNLATGQHQIKVVCNVSDECKYSNSFLITVKEKQEKKDDSSKTTPKAADKITLKLKKVKVKRSAKKLVLKATLKVNGKAKKGLKVKFKFKGKKYTAKTNKKGVAKVTIKKKVLKKLKVGKKVKYQASYKNKTVKKTVKVKK